MQTEAPGLDAQQVEALVTRPLEQLLAGTENVKTVRSTSSQGLSAIQVVFNRRGDPYRQRQVVTERLAEAAGILPEGVGPPLLSPLSSSMEYLDPLRLHQRPADAGGAAGTGALGHLRHRFWRCPAWRRCSCSAAPSASAR